MTLFTIQWIQGMRRIPKGNYHTMGWFKFQTTISQKHLPHFDLARCSLGRKPTNRCFKAKKLKLIFKISAYLSLSSPKPNRCNNLSKISYKIDSKSLISWVKHGQQKLNKL